MTIKYSVDGITWIPADIVGPDPTTAVLLEKVSILCGCPPYATIVAAEKSAIALRGGHRHGTGGAEPVNQLAAFTDNMWCRRGSQITAGDPDVRAVRVDGT